MALLAYLSLAFLMGDILCSTIRPVAISSCVYNGKTYPEGSFQESPCQPCHCHAGHVSCAIVDCFFPAPCVDSIHHPDQCCPVCPNGKRTVHYHHFSHFSHTTLAVVRTTLILSILICLQLPFCEFAKINNTQKSGAVLDLVFLSFLLSVLFLIS